MIITELSAYLLISVVSLCIIWYGARQARKPEYQVMGEDYDWMLLIMVAATWYVILPFLLTVAAMFGILMTPAWIVEYANKIKLF